MFDGTDRRTVYIDKISPGANLPSLFNSLALCA